MCPANLCKALHDVYFTHQNAQQYINLGHPCCTKNQHNIQMPSMWWFRAGNNLAYENKPSFYVYSLNFSYPPPNTLCPHTAISSMMTMTQSLHWTFPPHPLDCSNLVPSDISWLPQLHRCIVYTKNLMMPLLTWGQPRCSSWLELRWSTSRSQETLSKFLSQTGDKSCWRTCATYIDGLPFPLIGHIIPELTILSLFDICVVAKVGCKVTFNKCTVVVTYNGNVILTGGKDPTTNLWALPMGTQRTSSHHADMAMTLLAAPDKTNTHA